MKIILLLLTAFFYNTDGLYAQNMSIDTFKWLAGKWKYAGRERYEAWKVAADGNSLTAQTYRIKDGDTTIVEKISIEKREGIFYYVADVPQNNKPVAYKITQADKSGFSCENTAHDFPTHIKYTITSDGKAEAVISGGGRDIKFQLELQR
ncbi:MAG: hypothetical protein JNK14_13975 [Chitinophagaceae bacterium]|nr:hypothetical protein [Chitinophagaceae bacterium]